MADPKTVLVKDLTKTARKIRRRMIREKGLAEGDKEFRETMAKYGMTAKWTVSGS